MPSSFFFRRKECWVPTIQGAVLVAGVLAIVFVVLVRTVYTFLALTKPVESKVLVVEGWVPDYALVNAVEEFRRNRYRLLVTTGEPLQKGTYLQAYSNYAELASATLLKLGVGSDSLVTVPGSRTRLDRTYTSALALRGWLEQSLPDVHAVNIMTLGVHARRTRMLFQRALGEGVNVGVISIEDADFDPRFWWTSSSGFQRVLEETVGYFYAFL